MKTSAIGPPHTLGEWEIYIKGLAGRALWSKAVAANSHTFARDLLAEGLTMGEIEQIMLLFARQLRATGCKVPEGGPFDLVTMALVDDMAQKGPTMSEEQAISLAANHVERSDGLDQFDLVAGFED